jgi:myo-inositol-1(or 4)-monophosphatase
MTSVVTDEPGALLALACRLAVEAGDRARTDRQADSDNGLDRVELTAATKSSRTDVVTAHDRAAEAAIVGGLTAHRPDDTIVGEEGTNRRGRSSVSWFVDPIDGTTNFLYGLPLWSTSIGASDDAGPLIGVVYVPVTGELFAAERGRGATRNGVTIRCSEESRAELALVATGFGYDALERARQASRLQRILPLVRDVRRGGSAAIDLVYTAAGFLDAYYEEHLNRWDMAAGELIARESGCRSGDFQGGPMRPEQLLVAAPGLYDVIAAMLAEPS